MDAQIFEKISKRIDGYRDEMVELQKRLIAIPAISPKSGGKGELKKARHLEHLLSKVFDKITECHAEDAEAEGGARPNYAAVLKGKDAGRTVWIMAHMDVVPEGDIKLWNTDPFEAVVKEGRIYGRGSEDNNQAIVSGYFAAKAFKDEGVTPPCNLGLLLVSDEETTSEKGAKFVLARHRHIFGKNDAVIIPDGGSKAGDEVEVAEKSRVALKITTMGKQAHAAYPKNGINAHRVSAHVIEKLEELKAAFSQKDRLFAPEDACTFEPTKKLANIPNINTIPGEDVIYYDCRLLPSVDIQEFITEFTRLSTAAAARYGATVKIETEDMTKSAPPTPMDAPIVRAVVNSAEAVYGVKSRPVGVGGNTVAQFFRKEGYPCAVYSKLDDTLHAPNEYCVIDNMLGDTKVWCRTVLEL